MKTPARPHAGLPANRRGTVLPVLALSIVVMIGSLALAVDLGMTAIARTQSQQAADLAALVAARSLNGSVAAGYNQAAATTNAQNVLTYNLILGQSIQPSQLQLTYGSYDYNQTTQTFKANFPATAGMPITAVTATVTSNGLPRGFSTVFGAQALPAVSATAQAAHRPRDIALVVDLSGSMRMGTCLGFDFYSTFRSTNNPDPLAPAFGHYSSGAAALVGPTTNRTSAFDNYTVSPSNATAPNSSYALTYMNNFYQNAAYATPLIRAFDSYTSTDGGVTWTAPSSGSPVLPPASYRTAPGGDVPLFLKGSGTVYAQSVKDVVGGAARNAAWELDGYSNYTGGSLSNAASGASDYATAPFLGYTQGPGYYGKTFFLWPPDPRRPLTTGSNSAQINQFLTDFGFTASDFTDKKAGPPLSGIYNVTKTPGSQTWPWPNDGGTSLSNYLTTRVFIPGGVRNLTTADAQYQQIMRLYSWNYVVDGLGTTACDWRVRFFGTNDNTRLFNTSTKQLNVPGGGTYTINYNEILRWVTQAPNPFPSQLRAGRVKYYGAIPTQITGTWPSYGSTDQRFWVEFIDYVLGFRQTSAGAYQDVSSMAGYSGDFNWGGTAVNTPPSATQYMNYTDNPTRPLLRFWFSPILMADYLQNFNMWVNTPGYYSMQPGDSYEAPIYTAKLAFLAAIETMNANHPNDNVTVIPYSWPRTGSNSPWAMGGNTVSGRFNCVSSPLGTNYPYAKAALVFPFSTINPDGSANNTEITPYDPDPATGSVPSANFVDVPRADGETCFSMGLMLAYNQFATTAPTDGTLRNFVTSAPITFPAGVAGGLGRKGGQKVIIFETDGIPNTSAAAPLVGAGAYSYYKVRYNMNNPGSSEYPASVSSTANNPAVLTEINSLVQRLSTDYGTTRNPFRLYALGFGPVFQGVNSASALSTLQNMQYYAGTQGSPATPLPANQIVTGTDSQMSASMIAAFTSILQKGVQVVLIK